MRRILASVVLALVLAFVIGNAQAAEEKKKATEKKEEVKHEYVGVKRCAMCHRSEARGDQYGQWQETAHSKAYVNLATEAAKKAGAELGVDDPQASPKCLKCHVTAYGVDEELLGSMYKMEDGVGCESCHGPGGDYMKLSIMKDREKAIAAGLVIPDEELCRKCHNEESPTFKGFDFEKMYPKIDHPVPEPEEKE